MSVFLLEIGIEELPARFIKNLMAESKDLFKKYLEDAMIDHAELTSFATPRRLCVIVKGISDKQAKKEELIQGPAKHIGFDDSGNLTKAGEGFLKSCQATKDDIKILTTNKGEYLSCNKIVGGEDTASILPKICEQVIKNISFPKKMKWSNEDFLFARPIRWIIALLDDKIIPFELAGISSSNKSLGHRVLSTGELTIKDSCSYFSILEGEGKVILNPEKRAELIVNGGNKLAKEIGGEIIWNDGLLEEVMNLVEYPVPLLGSIDEKYLSIPSEVLLTSMEEHQKSFGVADKNGKLLPYFLTVLNIDAEDLSIAKKGWERVLKARLADAEFFWQADTKSTFALWQEKLEKVIFLYELGSMAKKGERIETLCQVFSSNFQVSAKDILGLGLLSKADLVSEMVKEFDSLQGIMGGIYAEQKGYSELISCALKEQYLPSGVNSPVPSTKAGSLLSIADKIDTLTGCFILGRIPTGANDTYALRRAALGIVRILLEQKSSLGLKELIEKALANYSTVKGKLSEQEAFEKLLGFFEQRLRAYFIGQNISSKVVDAALGAGFDNIYALSRRIEALEKFSFGKDFENSVLTFKRVANIVRKETTIKSGFSTSLFEKEEERNLAQAYNNMEKSFNEKLLLNNYEELFQELWTIRPSIDAFFDAVMVNCPEEDRRLNRLGLLQSIYECLQQLADFDALQV